MKNILIQQKKKFETKDSKPFASQLYLDILYHFLKILFVFFMLLLGVLKKMKNKKQFFVHIEVLRKHFYCYVYMKTFIVHICQSFYCT